MTKRPCHCMSCTIIDATEAEVDRRNKAAQDDGLPIPPLPRAEMLQALAFVLIHVTTGGADPAEGIEIFNAALVAEYSRLAAKRDAHTTELAEFISEISSQPQAPAAPPTAVAPPTAAVPADTPAVQNPSCPKPPPAAEVFTGSGTVDFISPGVFLPIRGGVC